MGVFGLISLLLVLAIAGWLMIAKSGSSSVGGELGQASRAQSEEMSAQAAVAASDLAGLRSAIATFQATKGRLPTSLDELQQGGYVSIVPANVVYDPSTGQVRPAP